MLMALTRQDAVRLYQILLKREPESEAIVDGVLNHYSNPVDVVEWISNSAEFADRQTDVGREIIRRNQDIPTFDVQTECDAPALERLLERVADTFSRFGETDPYWSVLTDNRFRMDQIDDNMRDFFETGAQSAQLLTHALTRNDIDPASIRSVLELGCGVGRVTVHLADQFARIVGVDVSRGHLEAAEQAAKAFGKTNIELVHLTRIEAIRDLPKVDCLYTVIVLQHNPPPVIRVMLEGLLDRVNPGGDRVFPGAGAFRRVQIRRCRASAAWRRGYRAARDPQRVVFEVLREAGYRCAGGAAGHVGGLSGAVLLVFGAEEARVAEIGVLHGYCEAGQALCADRGDRRDHGLFRACGRAASAVFKGSGTGAGCAAGSGQGA